MRSRIPLLMSGACTAVLLAMPVIAADVKQTSTASSVASPTLGYIVRTLDPAAGLFELRSMLGIPGAARFSDPIALPDSTTAAEVAPGQSWVLAIRAGEAVAFQPDSGTTTSIARIGTPAAWAFSPSGSSVALFYPDRGDVVLFNGLPGSPQLRSTLRIAQMDSFALSDNGTFVYVSGNRVLDSNGGLIYQAGGPVAFEAGRDLLVLFDSATSNLMEVAATGGAQRVIAGGAAAPDQLFAGVDRIYAGSSAAGTVSLIEYVDGSTGTQTVAVSRIAPSSILGTMLVSFDTNDPAWLVNSQGVSFVPAIVPQQQQKGVQ